MNCKLDIINSYKLKDYSITHYHCLCGKGEIIEERNSITDGLHITINCKRCNRKYDVIVYTNRYGLKTFDLRRDCLNNGLDKDDPCVIK